MAGSAVPEQYWSAVATEVLVAVVLLLAEGLEVMREREREEYVGVHATAGDLCIPKEAHRS